MGRWNNLWSFRTARFVVSLEWQWEDVIDLSWDDTGEVLAKCQSGEWGVYCFRVSVTLDGLLVACDYLGNSIHSDPADFRDHIGLGAKSAADGCRYGSYFTDMVREACREARKALANPPRLREVA